ncbi:MAG: lysophospholipid acyltransferase family protein [Planctomycetes bacterium]|nr:lysophospholipid acyltransferase family protein [Planctomycetota bacterium]
MAADAPREPLRRRLRAHSLSALGALAGGPLDPLVGAALGGMAFGARFSRYDALAARNLELALPDLDAAARAGIRRAMWSHTRRIVHEWLVLSTARRERVLERVDLGDSVASLRELSRGGRGLLLCTAHIGNWELLAARLRREGFDGAVVGYKKRHDSSADWLVSLRASLGVRSLAQDDSPRELLNVLRSGGGLGLLCDLEVKRLSGTWLPFLGQRALTMTAPAALARASGLPLVPLCCVARGADYELRVEEPLELARDRDRRGAEDDLLTRLNATYSRWIRAHPEQWVWYRPRFSAAPASEAERDAARAPLSARAPRPR